MGSPPHSQGNSLHTVLASVSPGTPLREGLDRIVRAKMGALVITDDTAEVLGMSSGGFVLDAKYSPQRLSELAKMDGAIILANGRTRIARANVHLLPDPSVSTSETGTRHRTAERVARQLGDIPVISVSEEMSVLTVYVGDTKHVLQEIPRLLERAGQALQTLGRYKERLNEATNNLAAVEVEDLVTLRDVATAIQRAETVQRIADEIETMIVELGVDARLLRLQLDELHGDTPSDLGLVVRDYMVADNGDVAATLAGIAGLSDDELHDHRVIGNQLGLPLDTDLDESLQPRGYRLLANLPRSTADEAADLVTRFGTLRRLLRASAEDLASCASIDADRAKAIRDGLARLAEASILDQYG